MAEPPPGDAHRCRPHDPAGRAGLWAANPLHVQVFLVVGATFLFPLMAMLVSGHDQTRHMDHGMDVAGALA